jgi:hypothetical protein
MNKARLLEQEIENERARQRECMGATSETIQRINVLVEMMLELQASTARI